MMIDVVIDTSIFRQDPQRKKAAFRSLEQLGNNGHVRLHVPYFVWREFLSHLKEEYTNPVREMQKNLHDLQRKVLSLGIETRVLPKHHQLERLHRTIETAIEKDFLEWSKRVKAKLHPVRTHHGRRIASDYFDGSAPFSGKKSRNDIPDSFIFQTIIDLSRKRDRLHVVIADGALLEACRSISKVIAHNSLDDFIKTEDCIALLINQDFVDYLSKLSRNLEEDKDLLIDKLGFELSYSLPGHTFTDRRIPSDGNSASILLVSESCEDVHFEFSKMEYLGRGTVLLPFSCTVNAGIDLPNVKSDYYSLSNERRISISASEHHDSRCYLAYEHLKLKVDGTVSISFDLKYMGPGKPGFDDFVVMLDKADFELNGVNGIMVQSPLSEIHN